MIESSRHEEEVRTTTKMLLANGHRLFRRGLEVMLSSAGEDIEVLGEAQDAEEPPAQERKIIERMLKASPASGLVVIAPQDGSPYSFRHLLGQGVSAYMDRDASPEDLVAAMQAAVRGSRGAGNAPFMAVSRAALRRAEQQDGKCELSGRELEVLLLASRGLSNRQSAHHLRLSEATVKRHLASLYPKMGVSSRGEATRKALGKGWICVRDVTQNGQDIVISL
ncbi:MAG TPA: response regulator transcription factor [Rubrobacteraceae bacterium]|nr:response regulator transcription factor [Rubrobacteraceae bacterium]